PSTRRCSTSWRNSASLGARETGFFTSSQQRNPSAAQMLHFRATQSRVPVGCFSMARYSGSKRFNDTLSNLRNESAHPRHLGVEAIYEIQFPLAPKISRESRIGSLGDGKSFVGSTEACSRHPRAL